MELIRITCFLFVLSSCGRDGGERAVRVEPSPIAMVSIPAGSARAIDSPCARENSQAKDAQHELSAFRIDKAPIDCLQYAACVRAGKCPTLSVYSCYDNIPELAHMHLFFTQRELAEAFCRWRGMQLPTALQWQRAIRGKEGSPTPPGEPDIMNLECKNRYAHPSGLGCEYSSPDGVVYRLDYIGEWTRRKICSDERGKYELYDNAPGNPLLDGFGAYTREGESKSFRCVAEAPVAAARSRDSHE